jgi:large subunit ribosomal protein L4
MSETTKNVLPDEIFAVEIPNHELLKLAYDSYLANARIASAVTKKRGEVRGGGKKPWKQKGTGRARFGSTRNPIWRGGGIVFGPTGDENYVKTLPKKSKRKAIMQALTTANVDGKIVVVPEIKTSGKTSEVAKYLEDKKMSKNVLIVVDEKKQELIKATQNIGFAKLVSAKYLNVFDILNADYIVFYKSAIDITKKWLLGEEA